jgi:N-acetyl-alpha-D-muramate 1-phosphate uridylyltransferase
MIRVCDGITDALCCRPPGPLARRERRACWVAREERATTPAGLWAAARRGAAAGGHLLCCRSSTMAPHRLRRGASHLPARRSRQSTSVIPSQTLMPVAILAGGLAKRLRPITEVIPKSLVDVQGEPFINHQLRLLAARGIKRVILCLQYRGELIKEAVGDGKHFGIDVEYSFDGPDLLGTAGAIKRALPLLENSFFVLYGDSYLPCDYCRIQTAYEESGQPALMTVFRNDGQWDKSNVEFSNGRIIAYDKDNQTTGMQFIDYGLGVFSRNAFEIVPDGQSYDLAALYRSLLDRGELAACEVNERFYEIGSFAGLEELRHYIFK